MIAMNQDIGKAFLDNCRLHLREDFRPRLLRCLNELSEQDIWWRAHETNNSVGNLVLHLCGNVRQWIIAGIGGEMDSREREKEFSERNPLPKHELIRRLEETLQEADKTLLQFDPSHLLEVRRFQKWEHTCLYAILHVVEHFSHHLGQIIYITKLRTAKDLKFYDL
jgi:uncharacterized damage-inducible protein DinB